MLLRLLEDLENDVSNEQSGNSGSYHVGDGNGFSVFQITSYNALQQNFSISVINPHTRSNWLAGDYIFGNQQRFNENVRNDSKLYIFTNSGSKDIVGAILLGNDTQENFFKFTFSKTYITFACSVNFWWLFSSAATTSLPLPFYLIPGAKVISTPQYPYVQDVNNPAIIYNNSNDTMLAVLEQWQDSKKPLILNSIPSNITTISEIVGYSAPISVISIPETITNIEFKALSNVSNAILTPFSETEIRDGKYFIAKDERSQQLSRNAENSKNTMEQKELNYDSSWNRGREKITYYDQKSGNSALFIDAFKNSNEVQTRINNLPKEQQELAKLRYKEVGNEVHITGIEPGVTEVVVPEKINGKSVTTIEPFAFYDERQLQNVILPETITRIENSAFGNNRNFSVYVNPECIVGKNNSNVYKG